jgi:hypothetical protein
MKIAICLALLGAFVALVHAPRERADFSLDDYDYVAGNPSIRSTASALAAFAEPFPPQLPEKGLYRPFTNLTYAIDFALWRDDARGYHEMNTALYVAVVWVVFALATGYGGSLAFGLAVALLFAAHPVHCEAVDSVTGRSELLSLMFALVSLALFQQAMRDARALPWLAGSSLAYGLSLLSKESGGVLPAVLAAHFLVYGRREGEELAQWIRRCAALLAPYGAVAIAYLAARAHALPGFVPPGAAGGGSSRITAVGVAYFLDLRQLVWPVPSRVDFYWEQYFHGAGARWTFLLGMLLIGITLRLFSSRLREQLRAPSRREAHRIELCALAIFVAFLLPVSQLLPVGVKFAERLLFAPSLGFCLFAGSAVRDALRSRIALTSMLVAALVVAGGVRSHQRALEWRDDLRLWIGEERALPGDPRVLANLAIAHFTRGQWQESHDAIARARRSETKIQGLDAVIDGIERALERAERSAR